MKLTGFLFAAALLGACTQPAAEENYTRHVDPKIGTGGHGHVFVGANVPFGLVQVGPTSIPQTWDWCSGYHASDSTVIGFSHTHLSGTGIGDLFDVTVMPVTGEVTYARGTEDDPTSGLWSYADRTQEIARPGYYSVPLTRYGIRAELTATARVGLHRYTFPASDAAAVVFDLENGGCWDKATETHLVHHDLRALAIAQRMLDGELAGQRGATGQRDLHQIARRELATILAELNVCAIVAERIPRTVLVTLNPQSLTHSCSFIFSRRRSGPSPCQRGSAAPGRSPASVDFSIMPLSYTGAHGFDRRTTRRYSLPYPRTSRNGHSDAL